MISRGPYQQLVITNDNSDPKQVLIKWRSSTQEGFTFEAEAVDGKDISFVYNSIEEYKMVFPVKEKLLDGQDCDETYYFYYDVRQYNHTASVFMPENGGVYSIFYDGKVCAEGEMRNLATKEKMNIFVLGDSGFERCATGDTCTGNLSQNIALLNEHLDDESTGADLYVLLGDNAYGGRHVDYSDLTVTEQSQLIPVQCDDPLTVEDESICGDFSDDDGMDHAWQQNFFNPLRSHLSSSPVLATIGNHEADYSYHDEINCEGMEVATKFNVEDYFMNFEAGDTSEAYYSHQIGDLLIISLNTELSSPCFEAPGTTDASRRIEMITWLDGQLSHDSKWKIVTMHTPIHSGGSRQGRNTFLPCHDAKSGWCSIEGKNMMGPIARKIDEYDVDLVMYGHNHFYERSFLVSGHYEFHDDDDITPGNGLPLVFSETDAMKLESDGCNGCYEEYKSAIKAGTAFNYDLFNEANFYKFEAEGTVFVLSGAAAGDESINSLTSPKQDFFNHPIMRPFQEPSVSPSGYINVGRAINTISASLIELEGDQLMYKQIGQNGILDQFIVHKCSTAEQTISVCDSGQTILLNELLANDIPVESIQWTDCDGNSLSGSEIEASNYLGECQFRVEHAEGCQTINLTVIVTPS